MLYIASAQPATAQLDAVQCDFVESGKHNLVINKLTRLEVYTVDAEQEHVELAVEVPVFSTIAAIAAVKLEGQHTSSIVVLTTSMQLFAITYSQHAPHATTTCTTSILEQFGRPTEYQAILVDPRNRCIIVHAYSGLARVIPLTSPLSKTRRGSLAGARSSDAADATQSPAGSPVLDLSLGYNVRLPALNVTSMAFLHADSSAISNPALAVVHSNHLGQRLLQTYTVDLVDKELKDGPVADVVLQDPGSEIVIPVEPAQPGAERGVLVVGEESVTWVQTTAGQTENKGKRRASETVNRVMCRLPVGMIQAWTAVKGNPNQFLLGDIYGKLLTLQVTRSSSGQVVGLKATDLGDTASPTALVLLSPTLLYLASRFGDSQLIRLPSSATRLPAAAAPAKDVMDLDEELQLVDSFTSLAPVLDCCVVQAESGGPGRVITCSGAYKGGSLRVVRQGVGLTELASLEMDGALRLWSFPDQKKDTPSVVLVAGFLHETRFVRLSQSSEGEFDEIEELDLPSLESRAATLHAGRVGPLLVQVTDSAVHCASDGTPGDGGAVWRPQSDKITQAASDEEFVLLAVGGNKLVLLRSSDAGLVEAGTIELANEPSCLNLCRVGESLVALVGSWTTNQVSVLTVPSLESVSSHPIPTTFPIRSVLAATFPDGASILFAGLGDGSLVSYALNVGEQQRPVAIQPETERSVTLGTKPVELVAFSRRSAGTAMSVFALTDRPTVVSRSNDRLVYSSVNAKNTSAVASFGVEGSTLVVAGPSEIQLVRIEDIKRVDVRAVPLDEDEPRRIAHSDGLRALGVVCLRRDVDRATGRQTSVGSVKFLDRDEFSPLGEETFSAGQEGQSVAVVTVGEEDVFVVGTVDIDPSQSEPTSGQLRLYRGSSDGRAIELAAQASLPGCPYAIAPVGTGHVAVAVNSQVIVYAVDADSLALSQVAAWGGAFVAFNLAQSPTSPGRLIVGDALRSVTLLDFKLSGPTGATLKEVTRDYDAHYMSAVEVVDDVEREYVGAETDLNLFTLVHDPTGSPNGDDALLPMGMFHLGEMVSRFRRGTLAQNTSERSNAVSSELVFATSAGSVGIVANLDGASSKLLSDLERNMRRVVPSVGGLSQEQWRAFKSERRVSPSAGFVDGDFVERFAELSSAQMAQVIAGGTEHERIEGSPGEVLRLLEELSRLH